MRIECVKPIVKVELNATLNQFHKSAVDTASRLKHENYHMITPPGRSDSSDS